MPTRVKRTERFGLRLTKSQRAMIEEQAEAAGLDMSKYIVQAACGEQNGPPYEAQPTAAESPNAADFEARVRKEMKTMPRRSAETAVRREAAREKAKAALASA